MSPVVCSTAIPPSRIVRAYLTLRKYDVAALRPDAYGESMTLVEVNSATMTQASSRRTTLT